MRLDELIGRALPPEPWAEGENLPWDEPAFSARMLREHLSQVHDRASRREAIIARQVAWIHDAVLGGQARVVLDLGCGPGLYSSRLARLGHRCVGIDFSPASITYAREQAAAEGLACRYELRDIRAGDYGTNSYGLVTLIYGELNVFPRDVALRMLRGMHDVLVEGGVLLLEAHTFAAVEEMAAHGSEWYMAERGLFGDEPYLCLMENFWHPQQRAATTRYFVVATATGAVTRYAETMQAYTQEDYRALLRAAGFTGTITFHAGLAGERDLVQPGLCAITAIKA